MVFFVGQFAATVEEVGGLAIGAVASGNQHFQAKPHPFIARAGQLVLPCCHRPLPHFIGQIFFDPASFLHQRPQDNDDDEPDTAPIKDEGKTDKDAANSNGEVVHEVEEDGRPPTQHRGHYLCERPGRETADCDAQPHHAGE